MSEIHNPVLESAMAVLMSGTDLVDRTLAQPLASLLAGVADLHEPNVPSHGSDVPAPGCQWCADEDWPCADTRKAMDVARLLLGDLTGASLHIPSA